MMISQMHNLRTATKCMGKLGNRAFSVPASANSNNNSNHIHPRHRVHLLFGANTDVGKSIVSTGLLRAAASAAKTNENAPLPSHASLLNYIKPLQCGGSDESFVLRHNVHNQEQLDTKETCNDIQRRTLFSWDTPASPHLASRLENLPVSDDQVLSALQTSLQSIINSGDSDMNSTTIIETAGGVLSPSSSSPLNHTNQAASALIETTTEKPANQWGWSTQADLYSSLRVPVVFVGDGKLGGISVTLSSLESLWSRGYKVDAVVFIEGQNNSGVDNEAGRCDDEKGNIQFGQGNAEALREYIAMQKGRSLIDREAIICLPSLPPMPVPLDEWYETNGGAFLDLHHLLCKQWREKHR